MYEVEQQGNSNTYIERAGVNTFPFRGDNFTWHLPDWQGGLEVEFPLSPGVAVTGGLGFAELENTYQMTQGLGLGFMFESTTWASRFDFGLAFMQSRYSILAVRGRDDDPGRDIDRTVTFLEIEKSDRYTNPTFGFTFNSKQPDWPINYFFNYSLGRQTFYDVQDEFLFESSNRVFDFKYSEAYNALAAGLYSNITPHGRLLVGFRWTKYMDDRDQLGLTKLLIQYDVRLN